MRAPVREPLGGLVTRKSPILLERHESPDLLNVLMGDGSVDLRGGFTPLFKDRMRMNAVRNTGFHATSRTSIVAESPDGDFLIVPGCLTAPHRPIYEAVSNIAFDLFFEVGDLTTEHGGNGIDGGGIGHDGAPYTIKVRPIFSKGPVKRSDDTAGPGLGAASITWVTTDTAVWGNHTNSGMPFCLYLFNNGGTWEFRLSAHALLVAGPAWSLETATSTVPVVEGGRYHIVGHVTNTRVYIRVARIIEGQTPSYTGNETTFTATAVGWNKCPFQVFDCPQQFIDATATGSSSQRPGLGLNASTDLGGYMFACKRAEGRIEDIAVWLGIPLSGGNTELDRLTKLDVSRGLRFSPTNDLANYWDMTLPGTDYVQDVTGRGNHLYFVPRGPITDRHSGGKDGDSWWFNAQNSYALIDVGSLVASARDNPNWNYFDEGAVGAAMRGLVLLNLAHGMQVEFWVDSIEPQFQQVIAEIHGALRLAINADGKLVGYCRNGDGAGGSAQEHGQTYQGPVTGTETLVPGKRYTATLMRRTGGTALDLYVDGQLDASVTGLNAVTTAVSRPVSGITLGMGSWQIMTRGASANAVEIASANQINTDSRSGFCGRIESFAIVTTSNGATLAPTYKTQGRDDWDFSETRVMINPVAASRNTLRPADLGDTVRTATQGGVASVAGQEEAGRPLRHLVYDSLTHPQLYELQNDTMDGGETGDGRFGHNELTGLGVKIAHCFAYYRLRADDRDVDYGGAYTRGLEYRYEGSTVTTPNQARNNNKSVHVQFSAETDLTETLGIVQRRCVESDVISETEGSIYSQPQYFTHRQRPYPFRSPLEVGPRWAAGMVVPLPGQAHVTLVKDFEVQEGGRSFKVTACGRQLYWAKPLWEPDSPFAESNPQSVFLAGAAGSHLFVKATASTMSFDYAARGVSFEGWVKPYRLDGRRLLFAKMTPGTSTSQINWMVYTQDGSIVILGTEGAGTLAWTFAEGTIPASGTFARLSKSLRVGSWNHVRIVMGFSGASPGVSVTVNGDTVAMADLNGLTGGLQTDAQGAGSTDQPSGELYIGGLPDGVVPSYDTAAATSVSLPMLPWYGLFSEFRFAPSSVTVAGYVPRVRFTATTNTTLLHLNEGTGWRLTNSGTSATDHGHSQVAEFHVIAEGLEESTGHRYDALPYRDRLLVSNGESRVQSIRFTAFTEQTPFVVTQLGMLPPVQVDTAISSPLTGAGSGPITDGVYEVWMSFFDALGNESDPTFIGHNTITGGPYLTMRMLIERLPRSHDPQVVGRRLYASAVGGGLAIFNRDLMENDGFSHEVWIYNSGGLGAVVGEKLVAPRGRHLAVANASLVVANLPDEPAGQNAFAFARGDNPAYFTTASTAVIDSQDGKPLQGIREILGQVFLSKRDSVYRLGVGALVTAVQVEGEIRRAHNSDGVGAGGASANNLIYGAGDRGVFAFAGAQPAYLSEQIEPTWREEIDQTDAGLALMFGAFLRPASQYWLSVRLRDSTVNDTIFVLELVGAPAWSRLQVPEHSCLTTVADPATQAPTIVLGTTSGAVLRYQETVFVDGSDDAPNAHGAITLASSVGDVLTGSSVSLGRSGSNFDTVLGGLAGVSAAITFTNGVGATVTEVRPILRNTSEILYWTEPLTNAITLTGVVIGGIDGYWTSRWDGDHANREQNLNRIGLEMVPRSGTLTLRVATIRQGDQPVKAFPSAAASYEEWSVDMASGWLDDMRKPKGERRGHYHRIRVGTSGIRKPFGLIGYNLEAEPTEATSHAGRRS